MKIRPGISSLLAAGLTLGVGLLVLAACGALVPEPHPNTPVGNLQALWEDFDQLYALFEVREVDWDAVHREYRPRVDGGTSDTELREVLCAMLDELGDVHIWLHPVDMEGCTSSRSSEEPYFPDDPPGAGREGFGDQVDVIKSGYLVFPYQAFPGGVSGHLQSEGTGDRDLAYLSIYGFDNQVDWNAVDRALVDAERAGGLVIDLRNNHGGRSENVQGLIDQIADAARPYASKRRRNGPDHGDLGDPTMMSMAQGREAFRTMPIVVLTDPFTVSAAEWFVLAMRQRGFTTVVGDTTRGSLSSWYPRVLPNGWEYSNCPDLVADVDGMIWEGKGIPPHVSARNTREANLRGEDLALDEAIRVLAGMIAAP